jgi:hypothetical protein
LIAGDVPVIVASVAPRLALIAAYAEAGAGRVAFAALVSDYR